MINLYTSSPHWKVYAARTGAFRYLHHKHHTTEYYDNTSLNVP